MNRRYYHVSYSRRRRAAGVRPVGRSRAVPRHREGGCVETTVACRCGGSRFSNERGARPAVAAGPDRGNTGREVASR